MEDAKSTGVPESRQMTGVGQFGRSSCMDPSGRFRKGVITHAFHQTPTLN